MAQYNAEQLLTQRDKVSRAVGVYCVQQMSGFLSCYLSFAELPACPQVRENLTQRAKEFNILVDDVAITHLSFGVEVGRA